MEQEIKNWTQYDQTDVWVYSKRKEEKWKAQRIRQIWIRMSQLSDYEGTW